ncbi:LacI family DNA-binding transcriptional regulator [Kribbella sp. CA-293567]|uniref:LacI family DNA-binding transcriptional regulator n=1 Tax=Kribbella sp. CA-293567 TaxID=3002436 RepID=UPI0022DE0393|nr:LacI family DNA-binding transcriptional regulator [Kribbella sp. CA-293567]WBQ03842.1 LacI family DNA-binding transcriptional regulator [Kribbella sp. CA-293567]
MSGRDRPATMEDVARMAGVSRALVSIVYRDAPGASAATRARVLAAGSELGYRPDHRARLLGRSRTRLLGVTFDVQAPFHGDLVEALYSAAEAAGYDLTLSAVAPSRQECRAVQSLLDYRCEALILLGPQLSGSALSTLAESQPVIVVGRKVRATGVDVVRTDDAAGSRLAVEHLLSLGHRQILHVDGVRASGAAERRTGYRTAMRHADLPARVQEGGRTEADGADAAKTFLNDAPPVTAVTLFNDRMATGFLDTIRQSSLRVPHDLSVVGYDNTTIAGLSHISLTTVAQNTAALAAETISTAHTRLTNAPTRPTPPIAPTLVLRSTTAPPSCRT